MNQSCSTSLGILIAISLVLALGGAARAAEKLDRGVIALANPDGQVYVGWRLLVSDPPDVSFEVWRCPEPRASAKN